MPEGAPTPEHDEVALLGGRARLRQAVRGYRAGLDAALLAAAVEAGPGERVIEAGCGVGGALVQAALRNGDAGFLGVERDPAALDMAQENIRLNDLGARVEASLGDVGAGFSPLGLERFDAAFSNPPFFDDPGALRPPSAHRRGAWMADDGLQAWCAFLLAAVRDGGRITMIHRADRLADLLCGLGVKAGGMTIRPIHPFSDAPAKRVLVRAVRGGRAPLRLLPPLVLHTREGGVQTAEADAVLRGGASLSW